MGLTRDRKQWPSIQRWTADAEISIRRAPFRSHDEQAKSLELRGTLGLSCLWQAQGKYRGADNLVAPVYEWFTEGFDTADSQDANTLLEELSSDKGVTR